MIKFRCSGCQKAIGVDEKYGGRLIKCPSCEIATRVPDAGQESASAPQVDAVPHASVVPTASAMEATHAHVPKVNVNPVCPGCNSELFNPSDTMCGVCGHVMDQVPVAAAPTSPRPVEAAPVMATSVTATIVPGGVPETPSGMPVNPAIASPYAKEGSNYDPGFGAVNPSGPTTAGSVGAWFAAVAVGMFLALIWGIIASFFGTGAQMFAWAIGAIVGLIAGLIARNPSIPFCLAATGGALLAMLFGRLVSTWVIMLAVGGMNSIQAIGELFVADTGVSIGVMEDLVKNGELEPDEKDYAEMKIEAFYSNEDIYRMPQYDNVADEVELELDRKVRTVMKDMTDADKQAVLDRVRVEHPEWMEHEWHFEAVMDSMIIADEIEDADLLEHAKAHLAQATDGVYDNEYYDNLTDKKETELDKKLREMIQAKYVSMDAQQRKDTAKAARLNHLKWTPVEHEYLAMLDAMKESGDIPEELKKTAASEINLYLKMNYDDAFDENVNDDKREKLIGELKTLVNEEVLKLDQDEVDKIVARTKDKYPGWTAGGFEGFEDFSLGLDEQIARFESDGTFWSSLKTRFKTLDFVWLTLGMISAFAIVFTLGQSGKKKLVK